MPPSRIAHNTQHGAGESMGARPCVLHILLVHCLDSFGSDAALNEYILAIPPARDSDRLTGRYHSLRHRLQSFCKLF